LAVAVPEQAEETIVVHPYPLARGDDRRVPHTTPGVQRRPT
jgi:hypothetical protein